jgi:hypothetical protein
VGGACAILTATTHEGIFAVGLLIYNVSWFVSYLLLLGLAFAHDPSGRLSVLASGIWLLMMSLGSLATGIIAQLFGGYAPVGLFGLTGCVTAAMLAWPLAR